MNKILVMFSMALFSTNPIEKNNSDYEPLIINEAISASMTHVEQQVRNAAVRVITPQGGHGSGSLIIYKGTQFVITAEHVADDEMGTAYQLIHQNESIAGILIYADEAHDIALLAIPRKFVTATPMKYNPIKRVLDVGSEITYSGFPSRHSLMTFRGRVAGYEHKGSKGTQIIVHTYGWFGCSGSVIYDEKGNLVGVLWGVDVVYRPGYQVQEDMIWISPIANLNIERAIGYWCEAIEHESPACRI